MPRDLSATRIARDAPPAPSTTARFSPLSQPGDAWSRLPRKPEIVGVGADDAVVTHDQRVHRADRVGQRIALVDQIVGQLFVRNGDVAAGELTLAQPVEERRQVFRRHVDRLVAAVDAVVLQPIAVDQRRARMGNRVPDDEGAFHVNPFHRPTATETTDSTRLAISSPARNPVESADRLRPLSYIETVNPQSCCIWFRQAVGNSPAIGPSAGCPP